MGGRRHALGQVLIGSERYAHGRVHKLNFLSD